MISCQCIFSIVCSWLSFLVIMMCTQWTAMIGARPSLHSDRIIVLSLRFAHNGITWLYKYLPLIMQEKIKVMKTKQKFRIRRIRFYSAKVTSIRKSPQITHRTHGDSSQSPYPYHTHTHGNHMGIPIPTAALNWHRYHSELKAEGSAICTSLHSRVAVYKILRKWDNPAAE